MLHLLQIIDTQLEGNEVPSVQQARHAGGVPRPSLLQSPPYLGPTLV